MSDEDSVLGILVERFNQLNQRLTEKVAKLEQIVSDFDVENIPRRQRKFLPFVLDWWGDKEVKAKDWRFYAPLILGLIGPIIGGVIVLLIGRL